MKHDPLCQQRHPNLIDPRICTLCQAINQARQDEQNRLIDLAKSAYARGREDAAVAVREFPVHSVPFLPSDTPLSMAVRVKEILSIAAIGVEKDQ